VESKENPNYKRIDGIKGLVYIPQNRGPKKYPCEDCYFCQFCADTRCSLCLSQKSGKKDCKK